MISEPQWPDATPSHWTRCQFQYAFDHQRRDPLPEDEVVTAFRDGQVTLRRNRREDGFTNAAKEIGYQHVRAGDLVIHSMDGGFGAIGVSDSDGKASPVVHAYRSDHCDVHFMAYYLRAAVSAGWIAAHTKGIRERSTQFDRASLSRVEVAFPSLAYQRKIVGFLDRETAEIDAMDAELNHLIQTLEERRGQVIEESMQAPSWHAPLWALTTDIIDCPHTTPAIDPDGPAEAVRTASVKRGRFLPGNGLRVSAATARARNGGSAPEVGDVFFTREAPAGEACVVPPGDWCLGQRMVLIRPDRGKLDSDFLVYAIYSKRIQDGFVHAAGGSTVVNLKLSTIRNTRVPLLPLDEQRHIATRLDEQTASIDEMIADANRLKQLLAERRSTLITEVVTGKKEVPA